MTPGSDAVFVMPYFGDGPRSRDYLRSALAGLVRQSDPRWRLVVVDDASPAADEVEFLRSLEADDPRVHVVAQPRNVGAGESRNAGVRWAAAHGASLVLFHDADDIAHERRLELTRQILDRREDVDFVYSTFLVIDEDDRLVPVDTLTPSISEILEVHHADAPVHGPDAWLRIATETGYTTQTSTVGVRIELALAQPFPAIRGCEDTHTWLRMSAAGHGLAYAPGIATLYRVPKSTQSSDRARTGIEEYYRLLVSMNRDGFAKAVDIAIGRGRLAPSAVPDLWARFLRRLAVTVRREEQHELADAVLRSAAAWSAKGSPS